jgi:hypothetical protein
MRTKCEDFESKSTLGARLISKELSHVITPESPPLFIKCAQPTTSCSSDPISVPIYNPSAIKESGRKGYVSMSLCPQSNSPFSAALNEKSMFQANAIMGLAFVIQRHVTRARACVCVCVCVCVKYQDEDKCDYVKCWHATGRGKAEVFISLTQKTNSFICLCQITIIRYRINCFILLSAFLHCLYKAATAVGTWNEMYRPGPSNFLENYRSEINPFQSKFSANRILPSSYLFFGRKRGRWITCNYPTVLKKKNVENQKEYNLRYLLAKVRTTRGKASDRLRQRANKRNKNRVGRLPTSERNRWKSYCRTRFDVGSERANINITYRSIPYRAVYHTLRFGYKNQSANAA